MGAGEVVGGDGDPLLGPPSAALEAELRAGLRRGPRACWSSSSRARMSPNAAMGSAAPRSRGSCCASRSRPRSPAGGRRRSCAWALADGGWVPAPRGGGVPGGRDTGAAKIADLVTDRVGPGRSRGTECGDPELRRAQTGPGAAAGDQPSPTRDPRAAGRRRRGHLGRRRALPRVPEEQQPPQPGADDPRRCTSSESSRPAPGAPSPPRAPRARARRRCARTTDSWAGGGAPARTARRSATRATIASRSPASARQRPPAS